MFNHYFKVLVLLILALVVTLKTNAQQENLENIKSEIMEITQMEIEAFKSGECEKFIDLFDDNITFYADGRKAPSKEMILGFCKRVPRPFEKPSSIEMEYFPISKNSAYVVRTMEFTKDEKVYKKEVVTKIWVKGPSGWQITHLHSTIKKL